MCLARLISHTHYTCFVILWFNFILGLIFISLYFSNVYIIIQYHEPKIRKIKFKPRGKFQRQQLQHVVKLIFSNSFIRIFQTLIKNTRRVMSKRRGNDLFVARWPTVQTCYLE